MCLVQAFYRGKISIVLINGQILGAIRHTRNNDEHVSLIDVNIPNTKAQVVRHSNSGEPNQTAEHRSEPQSNNFKQNSSKYGRRLF